MSLAALTLAYQSSWLELGPLADLDLSALEIDAFGIDPAALFDLTKASEAFTAQALSLFAEIASAFARVGAAFAVLPAFGERVIPARLRLIGAIALSVLVCQFLDFAPLPSHPLGIARYFAVEALIGLAFGLSLRLMVMALQIAGTIAAQATSLSQFFGGAGVDPQPAMSQILMLAGIALLAASGLPELSLQYLLLSYTLLPAGGLPDAGILAEWTTGRVAHSFSLGFTLAAPFVIGSTLYNLALGAVNRAMPQLMVAFVGAPALTLAGLALLALAAPFMLQVWLALAQELITNPATRLALP